jgi:hypothetical protein
MNPSSNETNLNLPPPVQEQATGNSGETSSANPEQPNAAAEQASQPPQTMPIAVPAMPVPTATNTQAVDQNTTNSTTQPVVDNTEDSDLIEKEWVTKAKQIVERTREDPHKQSQELTVFKADYMKRRYNKSIKLAE